MLTYVCIATQKADQFNCIDLVFIKDAIYSKDGRANTVL